MNDRLVSDSLLKDQNVQSVLNSLPPDQKLVSINFIQNIQNKTIDRSSTKENEQSNQSIVSIKEDFIKRLSTFELTKDEEAILNKFDLEIPAQILQPRFGLVLYFKNTLIDKTIARFIQEVTIEDESGRISACDVKGAFLKWKETNKIIADPEIALNYEIPRKFRYVKFKRSNKGNAFYGISFKHPYSSMVFEQKVKQKKKKQKQEIYESPSSIKKEMQ